MLPDALRSLPYLVHTNRKLGLILRGVKPLGKFSDREGHFPEAVERYLRLFDRHVASGQVKRFDRFEPIRGSFRLHSIFFTLPGEDWRVDAYVELFARPGPWCQEREREQGGLLGYSDWENDLWAERFPFRGLEPGSLVAPSRTPW